MPKKLHDYNNLYRNSDNNYDKFLAWAKTVPYTIRNPLYHWTHLELARYFEIDYYYWT